MPDYSVPDRAFVIFHIVSPPPTEHRDNERNHMKALEIDKFSIVSLVLVLSSNNNRLIDSID